MLCGADEAPSNLEQKSAKDKEEEEMEEEEEELEGFVAVGWFLLIDSTIQKLQARKAGRRTLTKAGKIAPFNKRGKMLQDTDNDPHRMHWLMVKS